MANLGCLDIQAMPVTRQTPNIRLEYLAIPVEMGITRITYKSGRTEKFRPARCHFVVIVDGARHYFENREGAIDFINESAHANA